MQTDQRNKHIENQSRLTGSGITLLFHLLLLLFFVTTSFRITNPDPQDQGILVEFIPEPQPVTPRAIPGQEPRTPVPDPGREIRLVQQAQHTEVVPSQYRTQASTLGETGEADIYEPPPPKLINQRALFRSRDTGDSLAEQSSRTAATDMQAGPPSGNTSEGNPNGAPSAALPGRNIQGSLPLPEYSTNTGGTVVVRIAVDQHGNVTRANAGMAGTTVQDRTLWEAAAQAALKAKFNVSDTAPVVQEGTITYVFILK